MSINLYIQDDDDSCFYDTMSDKHETALFMRHIKGTRLELDGLKSLMEFILGTWRYETLKDVMDMRALLLKNYSSVHESFHPVLDETWNLLRRLTNMYFRHRHNYE